MGLHTFNGTKPVARLQFLSLFRKQLENKGIQKAGALRI